MTDDTRKITRGGLPPTAADDEDGFAGMPAPEMPGGMPDHMRAKVAAKRRVGRKFTLPIAALPLTWKRSDADRIFAVVELTTTKEDHAAKLAGAGLNVSGAVKQMVLASIAMIGDAEKVTYDDVVRWYEDIGPRGRKLVDQGFHKVNSPQGADTESFLASEETWEG